MNGGQRIEDGRAARRRRLSAGGDSAHHPAADNHPCRRGGRAGDPVLPGLEAGARGRRPQHGRRGSRGARTYHAAGGGCLSPLNLRSRRPAGRGIWQATEGSGEDASRGRRVERPTGRKGRAPTKRRAAAGWAGTSEGDWCATTGVDRERTGSIPTPPSAARRSSWRAHSPPSCPCRLAGCPRVLRAPHCRPHNSPASGPLCEKAPARRGPKTGRPVGSVGRCRRAAGAAARRRAEIGGGAPRALSDGGWGV